MEELHGANIAKEYVKGPTTSTCPFQKRRATIERLETLTPLVKTLLK